MSVNKQLRSIQDMIDGLGIKGIIVKSKTHLKVVIEGPLGTRKVTVSTTPSDHRALLNSRSDMRRTAIEVGALCAS